MNSSPSAVSASISSCSATPQGSAPVPEYPTADETESAVQSGSPSSAEPVGNDSCGGGGGGGNGNDSLCARGKVGPALNDGGGGGSSGADNESPNVSAASSSRVQGDGYSLTVDDLEEVLIELNNYERLMSKDHKRPPIPSLLDSYLKFVAHVGCTHFPWTKIKLLFRAKLEQVIADFFESFPLEEIPPTPNVDGFNFASVKDKVFVQLEAFAGIPFTVQRIAELLTAPRRHYRRTDKFMRALEKNMLVVSTVEARSQNDAAATAAAPLTTTSTEKPIVNGDHTLSRSAGSCLPSLGSFNVVNSSADGPPGNGPSLRSTLGGFSQLPNANYVQSSSNSVPASHDGGKSVVGGEDGASSSLKVGNPPPDSAAAASAENVPESSTAASPVVSSEDSFEKAEEEPPSALPGENDHPQAEEEKSVQSVPGESSVSTAEAKDADVCRQQEADVESEPGPSAAHEASLSNQSPDSSRVEEAQATGELDSEDQGDTSEAEEKECEKSLEPGITDLKSEPPVEDECISSKSAPAPVVSADSGVTSPSLTDAEKEEEERTENEAMEVDSECNSRILQCNQALVEGSD